MPVAQFTLCGRESRELIALAVYESGILSPYLEKGRVMFKGSATVSCLTRRLADAPMRICGRITARGMAGPLRPTPAPTSCSAKGARRAMQTAPPGRSSGPSVPGTCS